MGCTYWTVGCATACCCTYCTLRTVGFGAGSSRFTRQKHRQQQAAIVRAMVTGQAMMKMRTWISPELQKAKMRIQTTQEMGSAIE